MSKDESSHGEIRADFNEDGILDFVGFAVDQSKRPALFIELSKNGSAELYLLSKELGFSQLAFKPEKKVLTLSHNSGGSSSGESLEAKFRFQGGDFVLIGAKKEESTYGDICTDNKSCGSDIYDVNYLTGDVQERVGGYKSISKQKKGDLIKLTSFQFEMLFP